MEIDQVVIHFNQQNIWLLNFCLGFIMFGIALDLRVKDFKALIINPKPTLVGLFAQVLLLPFLTFLLIYFFQPYPSMGLGLLLVGACPGGNMSNYISHLAKANVALSVSLTASNTLLAVISTPLNFTFWVAMWGKSSHLPANFSLNFLAMLQSIAFVIILPGLLGMFLRHYRPLWVNKIQKTVKILSLLIFIGFILIAVNANWAVFLQYLPYVAGLVFIHNGLALAGGYYSAKIMRLSIADCRTIAIETGIQNAGLGLVLIFNFFNGLGGMALIAGWWGIWHLISGSLLAYYWRGLPEKKNSN